jgi:hypothetical protein
MKKHELGMSKKLFFGIAGFSTALLLALAVVGCPDAATPEHDDVGDTRIVNNDKLDKKGNLVRNILYVEVNDDDPRIAMGYVMEKSGKQFFDYVVLFAANMRNRDCAAELSSGVTSHKCTKSGVHLHYNGNVQHLLDNRNKYIKPLQDRGIKVLMGLLGDWGGISFGTLGEWPLTPSSEGASDGYVWPGGYPFGPSVRTAFLTEVRNEVERLGLDGVDFDDEWPSSGIKKGEFAYPSGYLWYNGSSHNLNNLYYPVPLDRAYAWLRGGKVMADVIVEMRQLLGPEKIITVYEYHYGTYMPAAVTVNGENKNLSEFYNYSTEAVYGSWVPNSTIGSPHAQYAPIAIDICGGDNPNAPRPGFTNLPTQMMSLFMTAKEPYGANLFYGLRSKAMAATLPKLVSGGRTWAQDEYLSLASLAIYDEQVYMSGKIIPRIGQSIKTGNYPLATAGRNLKTAPYLFAQN